MTISYDTILMTNIEGKYKECSEEMQEIIDSLESMKASVASNYKGHGKELHDDVCNKIIEHLSLLKMCFESTEKYVKQAKEDMSEADASLGRG